MKLSRFFKIKLFKVILVWKINFNKLTRLVFDDVTKNIQQTLQKKLKVPNQKDFINQYHIEEKLCRKAVEYIHSIDTSYSLVSIIIR